MDLYIEKEFIDDFYLSIDFNNLNRSQQCLINIFKSYGAVNKYLDVSIASPEELEKLKNENPLISSLFIIGGLNLKNSIKNEILKISHFKQAIILVSKEETWLEEAEKKGALCFSFDNYDKKINDIINESHFRVDLSQPFKDWANIAKLAKLPTTEILISDGYIIADKFKTDANLIPMLQAILNINTTKSEIQLYTKEFKPIKNEPEKIKEKAKKMHSKLNRTFAKNNISFKIISTNKNTGNSDLDFHDRIVISNYTIMDSGIGFNLIPHNVSNSQITVESIFEKYTYDRINRLKASYNAYLKKLETIETLNFKYYPE